MSWNPPKSILCRLRELDEAIQQNGNTGLLMYKLDVAGPTYEPYLETCKGIKEVMVYKHAPASGLLHQHGYNYLHIKDFYSCDKLKTKWSSTKKTLHYESYLFFNKTDAEEAFTKMQTDSVVYLEKRVAYFNELLETAKDMSV